MITDMLDTVGIPYRYRKFKGKDIPAPPFITYYIEREKVYGSDCHNMIKISSVVIELYTAKKDFQNEDKIEAELDGVEFEKTEEFDDQDEIFRVTFAFDITTKRKRRE